MASRLRLVGHALFTMVDTGVFGAHCAHSGKLGNPHHQTIPWHTVRRVGYLGCTPSVHNSWQLCHPLHRAPRILVPLPQQCPCSGNCSRRIPAFKSGSPYYLGPDLGRHLDLHIGKGCHHDYGSAILDCNRAFEPGCIGGVRQRHDRTWLARKHHLRSSMSLCWWKVEYKISTLTFSIFRDRHEFYSMNF